MKSRCKQIPNNQRETGDVQEHRGSPRGEIYMSVHFLAHGGIWNLDACPIHEACDFDDSWDQRDRGDSAVQGGRSTGEAESLRYGRRLGRVFESEGPGLVWTDAREFGGKRRLGGLVDT